MELSIDNGIKDLITDNIIKILCLVNIMFNKYTKHVRFKSISKRLSRSKR